MIKINLLKNSGEVSQARGAEVEQEAPFDIISNELNQDGGSPKAIAIKIFLMVIGAVGLMIYESYHIGQIKDEIKKETLTKNQLTKEIKEKKTVADEARVLEKQIQDIEARIKAIKNLSKVRLREIKAIDFIQKIIPEKVWLTDIEIKGESIKLFGSAVSDDELNKFLSSMEGAPIFEQVILLKAVENKLKNGTVKVFEISSNLLGSD